MLKKLFYSVLILAVLLFLSSCASINQTTSEENTEHSVAKSSDEIDLENDSSYDSFNWSPTLFSEEDFQPEKKPYEDLFNLGSPTISNVPPTSSVPYAVVDDPNNGRLYITDFPIKNEENSFTIGN